METGYFIWQRPGENKRRYYKLKPIFIPKKGCLVVQPFWGDPLYFKAEEIGVVDFKNFFYQKPKVDSLSEAQYKSFVKGAIQQIKTNNFNKVVTWRPSRQPLRLKVEETFDKLCDSYHKAYVFCLSTPLTGTWMGASPENFLLVKGDQVSTMSLAGTKLTDEGSFSEKDFKEQEIVTKAVVESLERAGVRMVKEGKIETLKAGPVEHLLTRITGTFPDFLKPYDLGKELHPTPALGGYPSKTSLPWLHEQEKRFFHHGNARSLYGGFIGMYEENRFEAFVNLRSMEIHPHDVTLFAGGGIVEDSDPDDEWVETERKFQTIVKVLKG